MHRVPLHRVKRLMHRALLPPARPLPRRVLAFRVMRRARVWPPATRVTRRSARTQAHVMALDPMLALAPQAAPQMPRRRVMVGSPRVAVAWSRADQRVSCHGRLFT